VPCARYWEERNCVKLWEGGKITEDL